MEYTLRKRDGKFTLKLAVLYNKDEKAQRLELGIPTDDQVLAEAIAAGTLKLLINIASHRPNPPIYIFDRFGHIYTEDDVPDLKPIIRQHKRNENQGKSKPS